MKDYVTKEKIHCLCNKRQLLTDFILLTVSNIPIIIQSPIKSFIVKNMTVWYNQML